MSGIRIYMSFIFLLVSVSVYANETGMSSSLKLVLMAHDTAAPSVPTQLNAIQSQSGSSQVILNWMPAIDNRIVSSYRIYRDGLLVSTLNNMTKMEFVDSNVISGMTYKYTITALDSMGNESAHSKAVIIKIDDEKIASITPSNQTADEIFSLIKNGELAIPYTEINAQISLSGAVGPHYGVDENNKVILAAFVSEKYFGKNNWIFCHEATATCHKVIDNSNEQKLMWHSLYSDGKIFFSVLDKTVDSSLYGSALNYYDTKTKTFVKRAVAIQGLNGETRSFSKGTDGYLYIGGSNWGTTDHFASYARVNPKDLTDYTYHTGYYKGLYVDRARDIAADSSHVYQVIGDNPLKVIAVNKQLNTAVNLMDTKKAEFSQVKDGVGLRVTDLSDNVKHFWLYQGRKYEVVNFDTTPPWYDIDIHGLDYWAMRNFWDITPGIGKPKIEKFTSKIYNTNNGQGEFSISATINGNRVDFQPIMVDTYPQKTKEISAIYDNRIMVTGLAYAGASMINTTSETAKYLHATVMSPSIVFPYLNYKKNKKNVLFSGYGSVYTMSYDPDTANPIFSNENVDNSLGYLRYTEDMNNPGHDVDTHRPLDVVQIEEMIYMLGMQYRSGVGGALLSWNTLTDEVTGIKAGLFDNYQPRSLVSIGDKLVIATQAVDNTEFGGAPLPETPKIYVFDPKTNQVIKEYTPLKGLDAVDAGRIRSIDGRHVIGLANNAGASGRGESTKMYLYIIDTVTEQIVMNKTINMRNYMKVQPGGTAKIDGFHYIVHGDHIYTWMNARSLVSIDKNGQVAVHGVMPNQGKMAFTMDSIYISGEYNVRKINIPN